MGEDQSLKKKVGGHVGSVNDESEDIGYDEMKYWS